MTVGTGIFLSILTLCVSFIILCGMGIHINNKKQAQVNNLAQQILEKKNKL